jgi:hypothetical protein
MKRIHIFKAGKHTSAAGTTLEFGEDVVREAAEAYDPAIHEAPIVVGHPKDNGPAFGWISALEYSDGQLDALPHQVNADFAELVQQGTYKKVSASFYAPDAKANPKPGTFYLRHVGFLGAQPPAIKGLDGVEFNEDDDGVIEFAAEWETAGVFRRLREFIIEKFGVEDADKAIPSYLVEGAEDAARAPLQDSPAYSEGEGTMTEEELKAAQEALDAQRQALEAEQASFAEQKAAAAEAARQARIEALHARVDALVADGKVLPAQADGIKSFAEHIDVDATVSFGEGDDATQEAATDYFFTLLAERPQGPSFGEAAPGTGEPANEGDTAESLAAKAMEYREAKAKAGVKVSYTDAVAAVMNPQ